MTRNETRYPPPPLPVPLHVRWLGRQRGEAVLSVEDEAQWRLAAAACGVFGRDWQARPLRPDELRLTLMRRPPEVTVERVCAAALALSKDEAAQTDPEPQPRPRGAGSETNAPGGSWSKGNR